MCLSFTTLHWTQSALSKPPNEIARKYRKRESGVDIVSLAYNLAGIVLETRHGTFLADKINTRVIEYIFYIGIPGLETLLREEYTCCGRTSANAK
jgi:hypothetical protein